MSLQRRLLLYLLVGAPLVWALALVVSVDRARHEVNELFDSEMIRLARQVQVTLQPSEAASSGQPAPIEASSDAGEADVRDLAIAVWDAQGRLMLADHEGAALPRHADRSGFVEERIDGDLWRVYYLHSADGRWLVAAGQKAYERDELVFSLSMSQLLPWVAMLPVLLLVMAWAVRRSLAPVRELATELQARSPEDLRAVDVSHTPQELAPLGSAMNALFARIEDMIARERRFTADAAHELRTPLAVLRAQWDVVRRTADPTERVRAETKFEAGLERMDRLVTQMLALSRLDEAAPPGRCSDIDWPPLVEHVMSECLPLAERRHIELACEWPPETDRSAPSVHPFPLLGDPDLIAVLLRNLLDNAVRYAPTGSTVVLRLEAEGLSVENAGPPLSEEQRQRLGERFYRPDGQEERGSGLGVSIAQRIAQLHGLVLSYGTGPDGQGVVARLQYARPAHTTTH
ncbi:ATP-binding protein [Caldimonas caldifontis]|uniref:histidine kinase n=1 Tax=Caldimonas caldifontis TaxID=1452508 RepID=A0A2S5SX89_9BURK|nr:ATP-binding protein [Caldimonas caldifontis]PPE67249.1 two-component sensor histidine kinase [Caldimonas caldifontis]